MGIPRAIRGKIVSEPPKLFSEFALAFGVAAHLKFLHPVAPVQCNGVRRILPRGLQLIPVARFFCVGR
jgi:hypothetical protein